MNAMNAINGENRVLIMLNEWYRDFALEVELADDQSFLKIKETLTRIGVASNRDKKLYQSCHILSKQNKYYIVHFKELFALDGRTVNISDEDIARRNTIACLLEEWGMIKVVHHKDIDDNCIPVSSIKILKYNEKDEYDLVVKYQIGNIKKG